MYDAGSQVARPRVRSGSRSPALVARTASCFVLASGASTLATSARASSSTTSSRTTSSPASSTAGRWWLSTMLVLFPGGAAAVGHAFSDGPPQDRGHRGALRLGKLSDTGIDMLRQTHRPHDTVSNCGTLAFDHQSLPGTRAETLSAGKRKRPRLQGLGPQSPGCGASVVVNHSGSPCLVATMRRAQL